MKAIPVRSACDADALEIVDWAVPRIEDEEVLIDVKTFGLNYADIMARKGQYEDAPPVPFIPGYEVAGTIKKVGSKVENLQVGQKVMAFALFGGYAENVAVNHQACFPLPEGMDFIEGASIPVVFSTAYHNLFQTGRIKPGSRVLIHAAAGGVGLAAVQLAKIAGCEIFGTASQATKLSMLKEEWGVDHTINYKELDFEEEINRITNQEGIDIILDPIGGKSILKGLRLLRPNGRVVAFGASAFSNRKGIKNLVNLIPEVASMKMMDIIPLLMNSRGLYGVNMNAIGQHQPEILKEDMDQVLQWFSEGKLKTNVNKTYSWKEISKAHKEMESRKTVGKTILIVD